MQPIAAAIRGINEIAFAVVAMTLTLVAVYAPMAFSTGRTGKLFIEFALTLAGAVLVSGFVALTLTPMMCAKLLRHQEKHGRLYNWLERGFEAHDARLSTPAAAARSRCVRSSCCSSRLRRRRQRLLLHEPALGAGAGRGSRHDQRASASRPRARPSPSPPDYARRVEAVLREHPGGRRAISSSSAFPT